MAGNATIGALRVVLGADTASFEDGFKNAADRLDDFAKKAKIAGTAIGAALGAAIVGLGLSIKNAVDEADKLGKLSQSVGVPVEQLSQLKLAADLSGVSIEALGKSFGTLSKNMADAATNAKTEAARAFQAMGITVKDTSGNLKSAKDVLVEMAGKFQGYSDGAAKSALATATLGRQGAALIPLLNEGADGLAHMMQQADDLGLTIDTKTAKAASAFNDNLTLMGKIWDGIALKITAALLPAFQQLSGALLLAGKNGSLMASVSNSISNAIQGAIDIAITGVTVFQRLGAEMSALIAFLNGDFQDKDKLWEAFRNEAKKTEEEFGNIGLKIKQFWDDAAAAVARASITVTKSAAPIISAARSGEEAIDSFLSRMSTQSAKMQASAEALTMTTAEAKAYEMEQQAITLATEKNIPLTDQLMQKIFDAATAYGQIAEATERAKARFNELNQIGQQVGGAIGNVFQDWITKGGKFGDVLKKLASQLANIAFQAMVTKPLQNIFGNLFSGGQKPIFAASGANFTVPGTGGLDSVFTPMMLTPGEQVSVTPKGGGGGGGDGSIIYSPKYYFSPGMTPADMANIRAQMAMADKQTEARTIARIRRAHQTDSAFLNA